MAREILDCPEIPQIVDVDEQNKISLNISFISPYFGGGTEAGINDDKKLIRETSIRGQLRFWWRATKGAQCSSITNMREKEADIFGNTEKASKVLIKVNNVVEQRNNIFQSYPLKQNGKTDMKYSYVLFPFRDEKINGKNKIDFELEVKILDDSIKEDVDIALKAWLNFGGLGARTRRALGSLYCEKYSFSNVEELKNFVVNNSAISSKYPTINKIFCKTTPVVINDSNWNKVVDDTLKSFRQDANVGRNPGQPPRAGRSRWPEPEVVRQIIGKRDPRHQQMNFEHCFPRAEFGLPIIIDFNRNGERAGEPSKTEIDPTGEYTRYASPLIIKNIKFKNNNFYQIIIVLSGPRPTSVILKQGNRQIGDDSYPISWTPTNPRDKYLTKDGSAIKGFIDYITTKKGFIDISNGGAR